MSFMSGSEILPSGRTVTSDVRSLSRQKSTFNTSSEPIMYSAGTTTGAAGAAAWAGFVVTTGALSFAAAAFDFFDCAAHGATAANNATATPRVLTIFFERNLAVMFSQEVEEPFVVARLHVEQTRDDLVVAARFLQTLAHDLADVRSRDLALHEQRIDRDPERLALLHHPLIQIVCNGTATFASRLQADRILLPEVRG